MNNGSNNDELLQVLDISIKHVTHNSNIDPSGGVGVGGSPVRGPAYVFETDPLTHNMQRMALGVDVTECCLPPGWSARFSPTKQRVCFIHEASGTIQFTHPGAM
ncbi:Aste57867_21624 [Aphanomyces stellatus]|uniref:Aste57867_21624 protein n=1 Tax=Aphanomyces stellatus TaxID=120398 RepID=A0A485LK31_9STRA|nr:hypothetical protein As57867_021555 [Aphanomyces stellatus]VFT98294.1 Aste57867_21624 [Aphanomyces stellatus]